MFWPKYTCVRNHTHSFAHDERQQVVEVREKDIRRHSRGHQWNPLASKLQQHGIILSLDQNEYLVSQLSYYNNITIILFQAFGRATNYNCYS